MKPHLGRYWLNTTEKDPVVFQASFGSTRRTEFDFAEHSAQIIALDPEANRTTLASLISPDVY